MLSDNGSTFKATEKAITSVFKHPAVKQHFANVQVKWQFNVQRAPWWGGFFERMIQSTKRCLRKSIGGARLTYDELITVVAEVEMILNSRPLSYISSEDTEEPLTPSHLLLGRRVMNLPDVSVADDYDPESLTTQGELTRRMKQFNGVLQGFWKRWKCEYLLELREAHRHYQLSHNVTEPIAVGDVVIVHDDQPRGQWRLAIVQRLLRGIDGEVRSASVKTQSKKGRSQILKRPIQKLYPLEVRSSEMTSQKEITSQQEMTSQREFTSQEITSQREITSQEMTSQSESNTQVSHTKECPDRVMERPPKRQAAQEARVRMIALTDD